MILEINKENFRAEVLESKTKTIVDFWAPWCRPCMMMHPILESLEEETQDKIKIGKINIDNNPELAAQFGVMSIPTFIVFENGEVANSTVGMQSLDALKKLLKL